MITFNLETVTPDLARQIIDQHDKAVEIGKIVNRKRSEKAVRRIAADIIADQWYSETGETIKFECTQNGTPDGRHLVDGQTRLAAIARADREINVWIAYGVERQAFVYIDTGTKRSLKDVLQMAGEAEAETIAPAIAWLFRWNPETESIGPKVSVSHATGKKMLEADPGIRASAHKVQGIKLLSKSSAAFLHRVMSRKDETLADYFINAIVTGENLKNDDPFYMLREKLIANLESRKKARPEDLVNLCIKAWNYARAGATPKAISWSPKEGNISLQ